MGMTVVSVIPMSGCLIKLFPSLIRRIVMAKKTYLIIRLYMKEDADIDEIIIGTGHELCKELKDANADVIDAEIIGSSVEMIFDGEEGHEQTN